MPAAPAIIEHLNPEADEAQGVRQGEGVASPAAFSPKSDRRGHPNMLTNEERLEIWRYYTETSPDDFDLDGISARLGRQKTTVSRAARRMGLTVYRPQTPAARAKVSRAAKAWHAENSHPKGFAGHKHDDEARAAISVRSREAWTRAKATGTGGMSPSNLQKRSDAMSRMKAAQPAAHAYSRAKGGRREDIGPMYFRSAWEANYARYLMWLEEHGQIVAWEYEAETFWFEKIRRGVRSYKPDFRITDRDGQIFFVEVKGWMDAKSKTKIRRMKKYYPKVDLRVVAAKEYRHIDMNFSRLIAGWER